MASLRFREKNVLEEFLEMGGGYVLNFSDRTFADFFRDFDVDIDGAAYLEGHSGSKANRMRSFWDRAPDQLVGEILRELYPEPPVPLDHSDPFTLLVAVLLSAQTTDLRVNIVTPALFSAAGTPGARAGSLQASGPCAVSIRVGGEPDYFL